MAKMPTHQLTVVNCPPPIRVINNDLRQRGERELEGAIIAEIEMTCRVCGVKLQYRETTVQNT